MRLFFVFALLFAAHNVQAQATDSQGPSVAVPDSGVRCAPTVDLLLKVIAARGQGTELSEIIDLIVDPAMPFTYDERIFLGEKMVLIYVHKVTNVGMALAMFMGECKQRFGEKKPKDAP